MNLQEIFKQEKERSSDQAPSFETMWERVSGRELGKLFREEQQNDRLYVPSFASIKERLGREQQTLEISWWKLSTAFCSLALILFLSTSRHNLNHAQFDESNERQLVTSVAAITYEYDYLLEVPHIEQIDSVPEIHVVQFGGSDFLSSIPSIGL